MDDLSHKLNGRLLLLFATPAPAVTCSAVYCTYLLTSLHFGQYQIILLGNRGTCVLATCQELLHESEVVVSQTNVMTLGSVFIFDTKNGNEAFPFFCLKNDNVFCLFFV